MATLVEPIEGIDTLFNSNVVKVGQRYQWPGPDLQPFDLALGRDAFARQPDVLPQGVPYRAHIGITPTVPVFLHDFVSLGPVLG